MKKYFKNLMILSLATAGFLSCESSNKIYRRCFRRSNQRCRFQVHFLSCRRFGTRDLVSRIHLQRTNISFEVEDNKEGDLLQDVEVYATFNDTSEGTSPQRPWLLPYQHLPLVQVVYLACQQLQLA